MSYEAEKDLRARLSGICDAIAEALPGNWTVSQRGEDVDWFRDITRDDGLSICVSSGDKNKLVVRPVYPTRQRDGGGTETVHPRDVWLPGGKRLNDGQSIEASMSADKAPAVLARDIMRRVVEPYAAIRPAILAHIAERDGERRAMVETWRQVCGALGVEAEESVMSGYNTGTQREARTRYDSGEPRVEAKINWGGTRVDFKIDDLSPAQALALIAFLRSDEFKGTR